MTMKHRILCVDDNEDAGFMLRRLLEMEGYEARNVESAGEALEMSREEPFNLYVIDWWFAEGSGTHLCRKIREFTSHIPIIVYSGATRESDRQEALRAGASAFVAKPDIEELLETIEDLLNL
jgi:DNA-binding response OmpR family regulator